MILVSRNTVKNKTYKNNSFFQNVNLAVSFSFELETKEPATCAIYLKTILNFLSHLQFVPFKIIWVENYPSQNTSLLVTVDNTARVLYQLERKSKLATIPCLAIQTGSIFVGIWNAFYLIKDRQGIASFVISLLSFSSEVGLTLATCHTFWNKSRQAELIGVINSLAKYPLCKTGRHWKVKVHLICLFAISINFFHGIFSIHQFRSINIISGWVETRTLGHLKPYCGGFNFCTYLLGFLHCLIFTWVYLSLKLAVVFEYCIAVIIRYTSYEVSLSFESIVATTSSVDMVIIVKNWLILFSKCNRMIFFLN